LLDNCAAIRHQAALDNQYIPPQPLDGLVVGDQIEAFSGDESYDAHDNLTILVASSVLPSSKPLRFVHRFRGLT
jgi:hypothetical protein